MIGLPDEEWGRRVHAVIEPADPAAPPTREDVVAFAKARLAAYKVPKTVEIVDAIPRSAATKVNRGAMIAARGGGSRTSLSPNERTPEQSSHRSRS